MSVVVSLVRAARLRCPHCGASGVRDGRVGIVARCPNCGFRFDRGEPDYFLGSYTLNLIGALALASALAVLGGVRPEWPRPLLYGGGIAAIVLFALWFYPFSRLLWLALDLAFRGARPSDFDRA
jgi:uncharacterized protein (DUF983 family)